MKLPLNSSISYHEASVTLGGAVTEIEINQQTFSTDARKVVVYAQDGEHVIEHDGERWTYMRREAPSRILAIVQTVAFWTAITAAVALEIIRRLS